jgi:hypothetical protein
VGRLFALVALLSACGRFGFTDRPPGTSGGDDTTAPDSTTTQTPDGTTAIAALTCGMPQRFQIGLTPSGMAAVQTPTGFALVTVDTNNIKGWTYQLSEGTLTATNQNVTIGANANGTIGVAAASGSLMIAASNGSPATGTTLYMLDAATLAPLAAPSVRVDEFATTVPIAALANKFGYATQLATGEADVRLVAPDGTDATTPMLLADGATMPSDVSILPIGTGILANAFVVAWEDPSGGKIAKLDAGLNPVLGPVAMSAEYSLSIARSASGTYLAAWHQKNVTDDDDVYAQLLDANLVAIGMPFEVAPFSQQPRVSSDGTDFWLTYRTYDPMGVAPDLMAASRVSATGQVMARAVTNSGGTPGNWLVLGIAGQSVLVWTETNGSGPDLYFDPLCSG